MLPFVLLCFVIALLVGIAVVMDYLSNPDYVKIVERGRGER